MSPYKFQQGDTFFGPTGLIPNQGKDEFVPYGAPPNRYFCPQAADRMQSDGDAPPGCVAEGAAGHTKSHVTKIHTKTADTQYQQGFVFETAVSPGGPTVLLTIKNIGWPK